MVTFRGIEAISTNKRLKRGFERFLIRVLRKNGVYWWLICLLVILYLRPTTKTMTDTTTTTTITSPADHYHPEPPRLIVVAPTFYSDASDVRYALALESCRKAAEHAIEFVLIDASPSQAIRDGLEEAGRGFVTVVPQTSKGKKGAALREGIQLAAETLLKRDKKMPNTTTTTTTTSTSATKRAIIGFQELEKVDMVRHWKSIASHASESGSDIVVPKRKDEDFRATYPIEQYHSEQFANLFLDSLGIRIGLGSIDWTAGPVAFDVSMADQWLACDGEIWDAQLVPIIDCFLYRKATVTSFEIDYRHPESMKEQEGGNQAFNEKRLHQLNFLSDTVGKRMREAVVEKLSK